MLQFQNKALICLNHHHHRKRYVFKVVEFGSLRFKNNLGVGCLLSLIFEMEEFNYETSKNMIVVVSANRKYPKARYLSAIFSGYDSLGSKISWCKKPQH